MVTSRPIVVHQCRDLLAYGVVYFQNDAGFVRNQVRDGRRRIERVRIILVQFKMIGRIDADIKLLRPFFTR